MAKVLLIEDDSETAEEISAELADRGFEVERAANGIDALDKARSLRPDAMIVDRLLPGMDGLMVIEALRKDQVRTPVLVLSVLGAVDDRVRGLRMGGDDYLTKPFAIVELVARIEALLFPPSEISSHITANADGSPQDSQSAADDSRCFHSASVRCMRSDSRCHHFS